MAMELVNDNLSERILLAGQVTAEVGQCTDILHVGFADSLHAPDEENRCLEEFLFQNE